MVISRTTRNKSNGVNSMLIREQAMKVRGQCKHLTCGGVQNISEMCESHGCAFEHGLFSRVHTHTNLPHFPTAVIKFEISVIISHGNHDSLLD